MEYKLIDRPFIYAPHAVRIFGVQWYAEAFHFRAQFEQLSATEAEVRPVTPVEQKPAERWRRAGYRLIQWTRGE
jgi:hypothetical protein